MINKKFVPEETVLNYDCEILAVKISEPTKLHIVSVYRPPSTPMCKFTDELLNIVSKLKETPTGRVGDFNDDISMSCKRHCCSMLTLKGLNKWQKKPTTDSGTLIHHFYVSQEMTVTSDVTDCYYTDHDYVTFGNIYQEYYQHLCPHVDPHLSPPTAQQWISMCISLICVHLDHWKC